MNVDHLIKYIIEPTLHHIDLHSNAAVQLLAGTALVESNLEYLHQIGGPARGLYQCEPATHSDVWVNFLAHRKPLADKIIMMKPAWPVGDDLLYDAFYATAICRVHYLRDPDPLPPNTDAK